MVLRSFILALMLLLTTAFPATATLLDPDLEGTPELQAPSLEEGVDGILDELEDLIIDPVSGEARLLVGYHHEVPPGIEALLDATEGRLERVDEALSFAVVLVPKDQAEAFLNAARKTPGVTWAKPDGRLELHHVPDDPLYDQQWGPPAIGMEEAWNTTKGDHNITVSVVDTGIAYDHPDLQANVCVNGPDFGDDDDDPYDTYGHGTHVAGTVAAVIDNGEGVAGMADACLMAVKIERNGGLTWADAASGVQWSADNGADVIQMSWGGSVDPGEPLVSAIMNAHDAGVLLVASAGNAGCDGDTVGFPAAYPQVAAVAALAPPGDERAFFSSCGPAVELSAPGEGILSTVPETVDPSGYALASGTSMASPHASGVAALLWSEHPEKNAAEIRCILAQTSVDLEGEGRDPFTGFGRIDASAALQGPECVPTPPDAPELTLLSGDGSALLGWTTPHAWGGVEGYHIYRGTDPDDLEHLVTVNGTNGHEDTTTDVDATYHYAVAAFNEAGNGTRSATREITPVSALTLPHTEDWEDGLGGWTADGLWGQGSDRSQSGNHSAYFGIELGSDPEQNTYDTGGREIGNLTSPPIDLRGAQVASLAFWSHHEMEGYWWEHPVVQVATPDAPGRFETVWALHLDHSGAVALDLTPYTGQVVHLRFHVDTLDAWDNDHEGWYVDDLALATEAMPQYDPVLEVLYPNNETLHPASSFVSATVQDPNGVQDIVSGATRVDGGDWEDSEIFDFLLLGTYENLTTGAHTAEARITDSGGNTASHTSTFDVDGDPPEVTVTSPGSGTLVGCRATINGTALDEGGSGLRSLGLRVEGAWVGGAWFGFEDNATWTASVALGSVEPGPFELTGTITDGVGNTNETTLVLERSDSDCLPKVEVTAPAAGSTVGCTVPVEGTARSNDDDVPLNRVTLSMSGVHLGLVGLWGETNTTWETTAGTGRLPPGEYTLVATVIDQDGNRDRSDPITLQRDGSDCLPEISISSPQEGDQEHCVLEVSGTLTSPYGAQIHDVYVLVDGRFMGWQPIHDTNTTFTTDVDIAGITPGEHELVVAAVDVNNIHNQSAPRVFQRSDTDCRPKLEITAPADGETVSGRFLLEGTAQFPEEGLGVPTSGQLEIQLNRQLVYYEDQGSGNWSIEINSWDYDNGPLEVTVLLWLDGSNEHDWQRLRFVVENEEVPRLEQSHHAGNIGCSIGVLQVRAKDQCGANDTAGREIDPGLTGFRVRLSWEGDLVGVEYLSLRVQVGGNLWQATSGPGDTELVLEAETDGSEPLTDQVRDAEMEVRAGNGEAVPAVAVDVDYEIEADWAFFGAGLPEA